MRQGLIKSPSHFAPKVGMTVYRKTTDKPQVIVERRERLNPDGSHSHLYYLDQSGPLSYHQLMIYFYSLEA